MRVRKAVIPAAGWGTRFLPATKAQPKEMLPLVDKPIIQYVIEEAIASGIEDILIVTGRGKRAIEDHFDRSVELEYFLRQNNKEELLATVQEIGQLADIHFIRQKEPLGLGHAIYQARRHIGNEPFAVLLGDEVFVGEKPCLAELIEVYSRVGGSVIAVQEVPVNDVSRYGIIAPKKIENRLYYAHDLIEKPSVTEAPSNLAIIGRYVLDPAIFDILEHLEPGRNGEIQLTDGLRLLNQSTPVYAYEPVSKRYDVGDKLGYLQATVELALARQDVGAPFRRFLEELLVGSRAVVTGEVKG
ncbi:UTP--glucose-1-phosphate uridylyltransferase GalU [Calditerricola satsumensis]|uniref:UTP--glucose-1-phosphate uridylyltransferase n=1 Tax=Calditerricola satsumensis TaxID=373054 RepID=A0A8J3F962_9BACI|nr:UTP--glucose-1-phosphate uridylyltransferase GalU [Calditerricola satsumensis]GGJ95940.1 UTP--glucose-1-phosphate uridylyltransferase [Calditerricola satsumensis]